LRPVIQSLKHYVQVSLNTITAGTAVADRLVNGVETRTGNPDDVLQGSIVKAVFVEMWLRGQDTSPGSVLATLVKTEDQSNPTFADMIALHDYTNKKNVLYHTQGLTNLNASQAVPFIRQWFKIPKGKQRFGLGDRLFLVVSAQALDVNQCGFATYKELS